ncbi:hypothetical protein [Saccharopolyspora sp. NPDC002376]
MSTIPRVTFTEARYRALSAVSEGEICYHNGLSQPALGYDWVAGLSRRMADDVRHTLHSLWAADLIDIDTHSLFVRPGHRVMITPKGYQVFRQWATAAGHDRAT